MTFSSEELALTDSQTLEEVIECLIENFSIETQGICDQKTLFEILVKAASSGDSIENTAKILKNVPTSSRSKHLAIGAEADAINRVCMPREGFDFFASAGIPQLHSIISPNPKPSNWKRIGGDSGFQLRTSVFALFS